MVIKQVWSTKMQIVLFKLAQLSININDQASAVMKKRF